MKEISPKFLYQSSTIADGNMSFKWGSEKDVSKNRVNLLSKLHIKPEDCVVMSVEHKDSIVIVDSSDRTGMENKTVIAEALITKEKNLPLFLVTADCFPVVIFDPINEVLALAHLGWKPTDLELAKKVVFCLRSQFGSDPIGLVVYIGPGIHKESYVFLNPQQKTLPNWLPFLSELPSGETEIDVLGYIRQQLLQTGIQEKNIIINPADTAISNQYFSHYRSSRTSEQEGRFATMAVIQ